MRPDEVIQNERKATETMSETSEGTMTTSVSGKSGFESRQELFDIAAVLGIGNPDDLLQERFRVDRRKLEQMLLGDNDAPKLADTFFHNIMEETNTFVTWPSRLKIGAKSKKDPHIKVAGRPDDVRAAKEKIMEILDTRQSNRVTMKLDVSYTDHSHIIGKGGLTIKRVMEETGCHIHFPDSNRSNHQEKSNQVSIAGEMEGVERARARVRNLTPLIFSFELPIMSASQTVPDSTSPYVVKIQEKYNVQVMFRTRPKLHATLVVVKGCEWEVSQVKEATVLLIHYMCQNLASQIQVQMSMEISPQHHSIVLGKQSSNLKMIMQRTGTQIMFPDAGDPNIPSLKKSNVTITGGIHNVYLARQQLVGSLPLVLMFDLPEDSMSSVDSENVSQLMQSLDVFINVRHKPKQSTLSVIIKGIERNASNIYEARKQLLGLDEPRVHAEIPATYHIPNAANIFQGNSTGNGSAYSSLSSVSSSLSSPAISPRNISPVNPIESSHNIDLSSMLSDITVPDRRAPGCEKKSLEMAVQQNLVPFDYEQKKILAAKVIQGKPSTNDFRVPTSAWSGYGLSQSIPPINTSDIKKPQESTTSHPSDLWKEPTTPVFSREIDFGIGSGKDRVGQIGLSSNYMEHTPTTHLNKITTHRYDDLTSMLVSVGLEKYIRLFTSHEVDMATFPSLTEKDLCEIGITAWGARRKIMLLIAEMNKRTSPFCGSAAPGAERKTTTSSTSSSMEKCNLDTKW
ncbi:protein bicaudal C isoform X7 [Bombus huntii]|uniref:protein bicaudal C isoform X7 n=1 Tax=Bombus huntii TaxID=85661 RepID=UPI0021A98255|nr:protein bicaudal C isoform X7 [Bombus huntii]